MCAKRLIKIKVKSENYAKVMAQLTGKGMSEEGIIEEEVMVEDTKDTYKYLSTSDEVLDWEIVEKKTNNFRTIEKPVDAAPIETKKEVIERENPLKREEPIPLKRKSPLNGMSENLTTEVSKIAKYFKENYNNGVHYTTFLTKVYDFLHTRDTKPAFRFTMSLIGRNIETIPDRIDQAQGTVAGFLEGFKGECHGEDEFEYYLAAAISKHWYDLWKTHNLIEMVEVIFETSMSPTPIIFG